MSQTNRINEMDGAVADKGAAADDSPPTVRSIATS